MYIRKSTRSYKGRTYTNYVLVESVQTPKGPRQKSVCSLGDLSPRPREEWLSLTRRIEDALLGQERLVDQGDAEVAAIVDQVRERRENTRPPRPSDSAELITVDPSRVTTEQHREAGPIHVGYQFWQRLIPLPGPLESKTIMRFAARRRAWRPDIECDSIGHLIREGDRMIKCNRDQVKRLQKKLQRERDPVVRQRIQMILLREDGKTQPKIAELMGVSLSTVNRAHMAYDNGGVNALQPKPTGGRRNENMTFEEEKAFLARFTKAAGAGMLLNIAELKIAYEEEIGHPTSNSTVYDLLARHEWRKLMPRPFHPQRNIAAQNAYKKGAFEMR